MKIYSMTATFGKLENQTLTLTDGLNILQGPNEWGKSTWCAFLSAMLYGIDTRERTTAAALAVKERYAPWSGSPMAGRMDICWQGRDITLERTTRGRVPMGEFRAYETASGLAVPELTGENCGRQLLGVEKSVFLRTVFIRLDQMAVTQDEALRRRLNALVTTGDESAQSDDLARKLRDLKNKVRANRATGLLPQALAEKTQLQEKLQQLDSLLQRSSQLKARQAQVNDFAAQLQNHKKALAYAAAQDYAQKSAAAQAQLSAAKEKTARLEEACRDLPTEEQLLQQDAQERQLRQQKEDLQLELAMLPAPPSAPQGLAPHDPEQARKDFDAYQQLSAVTPPKKGLLAGLCTSIAVLLSGIVLEICNLSLATDILGIVLISLGAAATGIFAGLRRRQTNAHEAAQQLQKELSDRYAPLSPERWVYAAENYVNQQRSYHTALAEHEATRADLQQRLQRVSAQLAALPDTQGHDQALQRRRELADARREQASLQHLVDTLSAGGSAPEMPQSPDTLTYSEPETARLLSDAEAEGRMLHKSLGQLEGQMLSLGSRQDLEEALGAVQARIGRLEQTYAALELAQNTLSQAAGELQRRFAPEISRRAGAYLSALTAGRYDRLQLSDELALYTAAAGETASVSGQWRSDGTVDQLYLALRLSVSDALMGQAPLVLDDALARFDDTRLAAAMQVLQQCAQTRQILLFTCQTREQAAIDNGQLTMDN